MVGDAASNQSEIFTKIYAFKPISFEFFRLYYHKNSTGKLYHVRVELAYK